jgi:outer membrane protein assembly factor BamB
VNTHSAIACFDATTGRQLWRTLVGSANTLASGRADEISHNLLTLVGDRIYFNSNMGLIASLRTSDGAINWLHAYERSKGFAANERPPAHFSRDLSPAMYDHGMLYLAPVDTPNVFALDAETGRRVWSTDELASGIHLLGVVDGTVVVAGSQLSGIDAHSGKIRYTWPEQSADEPQGLGRGVIAGHETFFPTRKEIQVVNVTSGRPTRTPISLSPVGGMGANLIAAKGYLIAAGPERIMAFGESLNPDALRRGSSENEPRP